ncbi:hypothetical protein [Frigoriglobus tundricola]|uniref:hypothetical protein n=1 Tax=Frigoriglobus tundricola TaxID=2774151 RepID=UPI00148EB813|nr:hypothetical protein [Frigoriglobus tundricola]
MTCEARDGTRLEKLNPQFNEGSDPEGNRDLMMHFLKKHDWASRAGDGNSLVVTNAIKSKSPVKTVVIKSDKAIPVTVRWVPLKPEKKK